MRGGLLGVEGMMDCIQSCIQSGIGYRIVLFISSIATPCVGRYCKWKGRQKAPSFASIPADHFVKLIASEVWKGARGGTNTTLSRT